MVLIPKTISAGFIAALFLSIAPPLSATSALGEERNFEFETITALNIQTGLPIRINPSEQQSLTVAANTDWDFDHLTLRVEEGTLYASQAYGFWELFSRGNIIEAIFGTSDRLAITLNVPAIEKIEAHSGASVQLADFTAREISITASGGASVQTENLSHDNINLNASNGGQILASGSCARLQARASSGSHISANSLSCVQAEAHASTGGDIKIFVTETVSATASSGGNIRIEGNPANTNISSSSGGSVKIIPAE